MENQTFKITYLKSRSLAGRLSVALEFLEKNFLKILKMSALLLVPMATLTALIYVFCGDPYVIDEKATSLSSMVKNLNVVLILLFVNMIFVFLYKSLIYTLIKEYPLRDTLANVTFKGIQNQLKSNLKKVVSINLALIVFVLILMLAMVSLAMISLWTLVATIPLFIYAAIPMLYAQEIYVFEEISLIKAIKKGFKMGTTNWGGTFLLVVLSSVFVGLMQFVVSIPFGVAQLVQKMAYNSTLDGNVSILPSYFIVLLFLLCAISYFFVYFGNIYPSLAMTFQYFSATQKQTEKEAAISEMKSELSDN